MGEIPRVPLGKSGLKVSEVGLGMWQAGGPLWGTDFSDKDCLKAMLRAAELGINLIDTAEAYGDGKSETVVGEAVRMIGRERFVVATKVAGHHLRYDHVVRACHRSLRRLGLKEIDLYQIHWPDPWLQAPLRETMRALEYLWEIGAIRAIGASNFAVRDLEEARSALSRTDIVSNQVRWNLIDREVEAEVVPYCRKEEITIFPWSPLAKGILTGKYTAGKAPSDDLRGGSPYFREENLKEYEKLLEVLREIAAARKKTVAQVALNWLMKDNGVVPIPGAKRAAQAAENAGAAGWRLSEDEVRRVTAARESLSLHLF